jgi:hypothetical protein
MIGEIQMIKYFCNNCGKEIKGNVNTVTEEYDTLHYCDECQYNVLACGFKVGDEVITDDGYVGKIIDICTCDDCRSRGFFEPEVEFNDGNTEYIMISDKKDGFQSFYKIGDQIFGNLDDSYLLARLSALKAEIQELETRLAVVNKLKNN